MHRLALILLPAFLLAQSPDVELTAEPHHHLIFTNDHIRVFNVDVPPHSETAPHWHRHDYIAVTLGPTEVLNVLPGKDPIPVKLQDGQTVFMPATAPHIVRDAGDRPFRNVTVELLHDETLRHAKSPWPEDRALNILHGGTQEILFVKDAVRVAEIELQPGGMIPQHHHAGPHLAVSLTDYTLRSDQSGKPPDTFSRKRGESHWTPGGFTHTLTNTGQTPAKFITLEFPQ